MSVSIIILVTAIILLCYYVKKKHTYWAVRGIPYVEPKFPYRHTKLGGLLTSGRFQEVYHELKGKGQFGGMFSFVKPILVPTDLDLIKNILVKDFHHFHDRGTLFNDKDAFSAHLFSLSGEKWKNLRAKLTPTFTSGKMKMMFPLINDNAEHLHECLAEMLKEDNKIEVMDVLARFTTDGIGSCAFGLECNSLKNPNTEFRLMANKLFTFTFFRVIKALYIMIFRNLAALTNVKLIPPDITNFFTNILRATIDYREKNHVIRNDFLNLLIQLKNKGFIEGDKNSEGNVEKLTFEIIAAQAFVFFIAGYHTSSTTMTFTLYNLALNPDIQGKLRMHINDILEKHDNMITYESVHDMYHLDQVINETLRMYPPITSLIRMVTEEYKVPGTNYILEKELRVLIPVYAIQHDPEFYENPEQFNPDNFSKAAIHRRHPSAFLPFGDGPRNCIGARFGMMQTRIGLVKLLKYFKFSVCDKTPVPITFAPYFPTLSPQEKIFLKIEKL